jgi:hypothetical protein
MEFKTQKQKVRYDRLMPNGNPRYIRCFDNNGKSVDSYTVTFTGHYTHNTDHQYWYLGMSSNPFHPQGVGQHGESDRQIDTPSYKHLGKKISFDDLPEDCKALTIQTYLYLWNFTDEDSKPIN